MRSALQAVDRSKTREGSHYTAHRLRSPTFTQSAGLLVLKMEETNTLRSNSLYLAQQLAIRISVYTATTPHN